MPKYKTVVIDFPWPLYSHLDTLKRDRKPIYQRPVNLNTKYERMSLEEILNFPIDNYATDCLLFLWTTNGKSDEHPIISIGFEFLKKNNFRHISVITWCKPQGVNVFSPIQNMSEHCLVAYRGSYKELIGSNYGKMKSWFQTHSQIKHSEKPPKFYQMLRAWTPKPRIDIFARQRHYGFDGWGNEYVGDGPLAEWLE
jgi:N6-adenosine-specific RNA methylase IME4